ncbi:phosphoribosyl-AMP cyclohydrolase [Ligilactobacillus agilis]|uniref:phosphoribosyl-AMP cyclohydrolase n=1 Tax=Ligilactobacillus agilis TaxID=1601 RepID=UPI001DECC2ED|nr:phosphoribosyl-AMP cyclohydrolase [Ligilactobacillus agilis]HJG05653.1 phosphoribosyl-AMP cyclohydrolase [Ligilactobacillus agilis]
MREPDFSKGLLTAVVVDEHSKDVLMVAWMNEESYRQTLATKETWFWSRSRQELWHKGATSGNTQRVKKIMLDCDQDTIVLYVNPTGPACHTGHTTCFFEQIL